MPPWRLWIAGHVCCIISGPSNTTRDGRRELRNSLNLEWPCCGEFLTYSSPCCFNSYDRKILHKNTLLHGIVRKKLQMTWMRSLTFFFFRWDLAALTFVPDSGDSLMGDIRQIAHSMPCFPWAQLYLPGAWWAKDVFTCSVKSQVALAINSMLEFHDTASCSNIL